MKVHRCPPRDLDGGIVDAVLGDSFFASPGFAGLWHEVGGRPGYLLVEDSGAVAAVFPFVEFGEGRLRRMQSMPDGCYGGIHVHPDADPGVGAAALDAIAGEGYLRAVVVDYQRRLPEDPRFELREETTLLVSIDDDGWQPGDKKLCSQIRAAQRRGIEVCRFDWDRHHEGFLRLVASTARRHRRAPTYPPRFYRQLARLADEDDRISWLWCEHEGRPACSHIYFMEQGMLQGWQIQFDKQFSHLKPNQYMRHRSCVDAAARGCRVLNLGATPKGAEGLLYYKRRWGGSGHSYRRFESRNWLGRALGLVRPS